MSAPGLNSSDAAPFSGVDPIKLAIAVGLGEIDDWDTVVASYGDFEAQVDAAIVLDDPRVAYRATQKLRERAVRA